MLILAGLQKNAVEDGPEARETRSLCQDSNGHCKAHMPRELLSQTYFDAATGAIQMKKGEALDTSA